MSTNDDILNYGRPLTRRQFDAYCFCRIHPVHHLIEEVEWYSLFENRLLGLVVRDLTDNDFGFCILGRDSRRLFRCIYSCREYFATPILARKALAIKLSNDFLGKIQEIYPQGDETLPALNLFNEILPESKQHPAYTLLSRQPKYEAARNLISEIANSFVDKDGHYEQEFQSINFQARLWELYLHIYFYTTGLLSVNSHVSPDFEVSFFGEKLFIEAVTVNPSNDPKRPDPSSSQTQGEVNEKLNGFMQIKFGSALYSKLRKKYWELKHVQGHSLILAIHDYHDSDSMTWSRNALLEYLYGVRTTRLKDSVKYSRIEKFFWNNKEISAGFFNLEGAENISAVLFSNQATIPKFNRMGKIAGLGSSEIKMKRTGCLYNPDGLDPIHFTLDIDDPAYEEGWSDGLVMFHNPRAKIPVNKDIFNNISHIYYSEETGYTGYYQPYDVLFSKTLVFIEV